MKQRSYFTFIIIILTLLSLACSTLRELANVQKPLVTLDKMQITGLSFENISFKFDVGVDNPNNLSVKLAGFEFDFQLNDQSFIQGKQQQDVLIEAQSKSTVDVPITLEYSNIYSNYKNLENLDSSNYQLNLGLFFDIPVLGKTKIPVTTKGNFPLIKLPSIKISSLKLNNLNFTSANLTLNLNFNNPNPIGLLLNNINYTLTVNGNNWISGASEKSQRINKSSANILEIPIQLNFMQLGQTAYSIISGNSMVEYTLNGFVNIGGDNSLLQNRDISINQSGVLEITK